MSLWETVTTWARESSDRMSSTIAKVPSFWDPSVFFFKASDQIYETGMALINKPDDTPAAVVVKAGADKLLTGDTFTSTITDTAEYTADTAGAVYETVSDAARSVGDALGMTPGSVPLYIKLAVAASVVVGVYIMLSGVRRHAPV